MGAAAIPVAIAVGRSVGGAVGANQRRQKEKGRLGDAYRSGARNLTVRQSDAQQSASERLVARGLAGGGGLAPYGVVQPSQGPTVPGMAVKGQGYTAPGGANSQTTAQPRGTGVTNPTGPTAPRTLGQQYMADLVSEQRAEQTDLRQEYDNALQRNDADYTDAVIGSIASGLGSAYGAYTGLSAYGDAKKGGTGDANADILKAPTKAMPDLSGVAFGGINPINPLASGAWARPQSVDSFTVTGRRYG